MNIEEALSALDEIQEAAQRIRDDIEAAVDDVDQQIEDGELSSHRRDFTILELMDGASESISLLRGQTEDLAMALDD